MLQNGASLLTFDFQGAGLSGGNYITLGHREKDDIDIVLKEATNRGFRRIILWGRSMGATTAITYMLEQFNPCVVGLILDSPFQNLSKLAKNIIRQRIHIPSMLIKGILSLIQNQIIQKAHFNLSDVKLPDKIKLNLPMLMICSKKDKLISFKYFDRIFKSYLGNKKMIFTGSEHNDQREAVITRQIVQWIQQFGVVQEKKQFLQSRPLFEKNLSKVRLESSVDHGKLSPVIGDDASMSPMVKKMSDGSKIKNRICSVDNNNATLSKLDLLRSRMQQNRKSTNDLLITRKQVSERKCQNSALLLKENLKKGFQNGLEDRIRVAPGYGDYR